MGADGSAILPGGGGSATAYLVGRELCLFTTVDAARIPVKQRRNYVELAVRHAAPYQDPDFDCAWVGDQAAVWYWSRSRILALSGDGPPSGRARFLAESSHLGQIHTDAIELLQLPNGVEARIWRDRKLAASRWWSQTPGTDAWRAFVRGAGFPVSTPLPSAESVEAGVRWSDRGTGGGGLGHLALDQHAPRVALALGVAALGLFCWQIGTGARAAYDGWQASSRIRGLDASLTKILDARSTADAARAEIDRLMALREGVPQHSLLAEVARLTGENGARLQIWQQPHPDRIEATLVVSQPSPEAVVQAWEASPFFSDVNVEIGRVKDTLLVRAAVVDGRSAGTINP